MSELNLDSSHRILSIPLSLPSAPPPRQGQNKFEDALQSSSRVPIQQNDASSDHASSESTTLNQESNVNSKESTDENSRHLGESPEQTEGNPAVEGQKTSRSDQKKTTETAEEETSDKKQNAGEEIVVAVIAPQTKATHTVVENVNTTDEVDETNRDVIDVDDIGEQFKRSAPTTLEKGKLKDANAGLPTFVVSLPKNENIDNTIKELDRETTPPIQTNQEHPIATVEASEDLVQTVSKSEIQEASSKKLKLEKAKSRKEENIVEDESKETNTKTVETKPTSESVEQPEQVAEEPNEQKTSRETNHASQINATDSKIAATVNVIAAIEAQTISTASLTAEKSSEKSRDNSDASTTRTVQDATAPKPNNQNEIRTPIVPPALLQRRDEAQSAQQSRNDGSLTEIERVRLVQRVAKAFHTLGNNEGEMKLRLSPPELGAVKLEVTYREGVLHARMETESTSTRNILMDNLPQLKERLAEQNVRIETFDVNVRDENSGNNSQQQYDFAREQMERARARAQNLPNQSAQIARAATSTITRNISLNQNSTQLNVII